jgi:hypothetical protein
VHIEVLLPAIFLEPLATNRALYRSILQLASRFTFKTNVEAAVVIVNLDPIKTHALNPFIRCVCMRIDHSGHCFVALTCARCKAYRIWRSNGKLLNEYVVLDNKDASSASMA